MDYDKQATGQRIGRERVRLANERVRVHYPDFLCGDYAPAPPRRPEKICGPSTEFTMNTQVKRKNSPDGSTKRRRSILCTRAEMDKLMLYFGRRPDQARAAELQPRAIVLTDKQLNEAKRILAAWRSGEIPFEKQAE